MDCPGQPEEREALEARQQAMMAEQQEGDMSLTKLLPVILLMMATGVRPPPGMKLNDSGIRRVWLRSSTTGSRHVSQDRKAGPPLVPLSNGRQINLADWKVVLFMQGIALTVTSLTRY